MTTENITITVNDSGAVSVKKDIDGIGTASIKSASGVDLLNKNLTRTKGAFGNQSVGNIAAQFQDIAVTAAASQNPLQIALQQGTQLSAAFGSGGLGGVLKQLGSAFAVVLSPVSLLTIGLVGLAAVGIQAVNWMKLFTSGALYALQALEYLIDILPQYIPLLTAVGAAFLVAFGPAILGAVLGLTTAIGGALIGAVTALFVLIASNPLTVLAASIAYIITQMYSWRDILTGLIYLWGTLEEVIGRALAAFGVATDLAEHGLQIQINATEAADKIVSAGDNLRDKLDSVLNKGQSYLRDALEKGSVTGAKSLKEGVEAGAKNGASEIEAAYARLNGAVVKPLGDTLVDGGKFIQNQVTGAITKAAPELNNSVTTGGQVAGNTIKKSMVSGGQAAAQSLILAGNTVSGAIAEVLQTSALQVAAIIKQQMSASIAETLANAAKANAEARAIIAGIDPHHPGGSSSSGSSFGSSSASSSIGMAFGNSSNTPSGVGQKFDVQKERAWLIRQGLSNAAADASLGLVNGKSPDNSNNNSIKITNIIDPNAGLQAINTPAGTKTLLNVIKANRSDFQAILGVI